MLMSKISLVATMTMTILVGAFAAPVVAQTSIQINAAAPSPHTNVAFYRYYFENDRFTVPMQEVLLDGHGHGQYRYKRKDMTDEIALKFEIAPRLLGEIQSLFEQLAFLTSTEDYQHKKDFSHLGTMTLTMSQGGKERTARFNYTDNQQINQLIQIFRGLATQEARLFEIETIRASDPISTPAQLRMLESELKSRNIADPHRFDSLLKDLRQDESVPLIARNHAERLLQTIAKMK